MNNVSKRGSVAGGIAAGLLIGLNAIAEAERERVRRDSVPIGLPPRRNEVSEYFDEAWDRIPGEVKRNTWGDPSFSEVGEIGQLFKFVDNEGNRMIAYRSAYADVSTLTFKDVGLNGAVFANRTALRSFDRGIRRATDALALHDVRELLEVVPVQCAQRNRRLGW